MAIAQLLALARSLAIARFVKSGNCDGLCGCKRCGHCSTQRKHGAQPSFEAQVARCCATLSAAGAQLGAVVTHTKAWFHTRFAPKGPELLVLILAIVGASAVRLGCDVFGEPSLLWCCCAVWPTALLVGGGASMLLQASFMSRQCNTRVFVRGKAGLFAQQVRTVHTALSSGILRQAALLRIGLDRVNDSIALLASFP
eukprot:CAMPEP_0172861208 /NCGR_PEP_ID=MMETSP1075-20121228/72527_1 /TAXON_ID=2916 /ORGANISM="Ceratium fusus, Strain PA161109" /LENGTH=197 /DNA_ID=CAMNT_0013709325 /DNA_START=187 /DNA_END=778 /DNA_ORIENTATION=+